MSNMAEKLETGDDFPEQMMLFEELVEVSTSLFRWQQDVHDTTVRNFVAGQLVIRQGGKAETVFEIISGTLKLSQVTEDGRHIILGFPSRGKVIGLTAGKEYRHAAETLTITRLRPVHGKQFYEQLCQNHSAREKFLGWIDAQEQMAQDHIAILSLQSPMAKLATFLLTQILQQRKGTGHDGMIIDLPMTQKDIATHLAIAPETCSRAMKKLREDATIEGGGRNYHGQLLKILNRERLSKTGMGHI